MFHGHQHVTKNPSARVSDVLGRAYAGVLGEQDVKCGSATACVVSIDTQRATLEAANLGDSGYAILRPSSVNDSASSYQVIYSSPSQTHYFNCPRQLTKLEPGADAEGMVMDLPEHADVTRQQLKPGDMVVLFVSRRTMSSVLGGKLILLFLADGRPVGQCPSTANRGAALSRRSHAQLSCQLLPLAIRTSP